MLAPSDWTCSRSLYEQLDDIVPESAHRQTGIKGHFTSISVHDCSAAGSAVPEVWTELRPDSDFL